MDAISIAILGAMFVVMYFFIIRPQQNQVKQAKAFQDSIEKGARVVTTGGIHGKIIKSDETTVLLEVDSNTKIRIEKSGLSMELTKAAYGEGEKKTEVAEAK